ncbi:MAG: hypothetical protein KAX37_01960 [Opitutaceae bacterium]|nr:hypothetical protein [Opitutaceae bacterium]
MSNDSSDTFEEFAKVELMGHSVLIARVTKASIGGFIRCDVLNSECGIEQTKLISPKAVYAISLLTKETAIACDAIRSAARDAPPYSEARHPRTHQPRRRFRL